ncbi:hypothetical protein LY78DRAFT_662538 [Colletotrichum sublineola]|nr:hypothetical protein LY78DRAFT_662538 [Colletotrichum sublineola]
MAILDTTVEMDAQQTSKRLFKLRNIRSFLCHSILYRPKVTQRKPTYAQLDEERCITRSVRPDPQQTN